MVGILSPFLLGRLGLFSGAFAVSFRECKSTQFLEFFSQNSKNLESVWILEVDQQNDPTVPRRGALEQ